MALFKKKKESTDLIIRRNSPLVGICSYLLTAPGAMLYALEHGKTPIVDLQTLPNYYLLPEEVGKVNAWEYFFEQPCGKSLSDADPHAEILDGMNTVRPDDHMEFLTNEGLLAFWRDFFKKYIRFQPDAKLFIDTTCDTIFQHADRSRTIGVLCRGTEYAKMKFHGHPAQPDADEIFRYLDAHSDDWDHVFLATEDLEILEDFRNRLGDRLLYCEGNRIEKYDTGALADYVRDKKWNLRQLGLDYLAAMYCLSRCGTMLAGRTSGSVAATLWAEPSQKAIFYNLGRYGMDETYAEEGRKLLREQHLRD